MRLLVIAARPPWPPRRGDQARAAGLIGSFRSRHEVRLLALIPPQLAAAPAPPGVAATYVASGWIAQGLAMASHLGRPLQVGLHSVAGFEKAAASAARAFRPDVVLIVLSRLGALAPRLAGTPVVLDFIDSLALNMEHRAKRQVLLAPLLALEARRMAAWDRSLLPHISLGVVVSHRDRSAIAAGQQSLAEKIAVVPFGVPVRSRPPDPRPSNGVVLLSGNLGYFPTVDGARWFSEQIWPRIRATEPGAGWWLAGSRPSKAVERLVRLPGVSLFRDPEDLAPFLDGAAVSVAPMRSGSGTPIKVLEAMARGIPVVTTPIAAAGLDGVPGEALAVATDPESFAESVTRLLRDRDHAARQAREAWEWVHATHSLDVVAAAFERLLERAAADRT